MVPGDHAEYDGLERPFEVVVQSLHCVPVPQSGTHSPPTCNVPAPHVTQSPEYAVFEGLASGTEAKARAPPASAMRTMIVERMASGAAGEVVAEVHPR